MKPTPFCNMKDGLEEIAANQGRGKSQTRADVRRTLSLGKTLVRFLKKIVEERFQNSVTDKN